MQGLKRKLIDHHALEEASLMRAHSRLALLWPPVCLLSGSSHPSPLPSGMSRSRILPSTQCVSDTSVLMKSGARYNEFNMGTLNPELPANRNKAMARQ